MNLISAVEEEFSISLDFDEVVTVVQYQLLQQIVCQKAG
jgi:acyl carrier protein